MCINLGGAWNLLVTPLPLIRDAAKSMGVDPNVASLLTGDLGGHLMATEAEKDRKKEEERIAAENKAWQDYYATRDARPGQPGQAGRAGQAGMKGQAGQAGRAASGSPVASGASGTSAFSTKQATRQATQPATRLATQPGAAGQPGVTGQSGTKSRTGSLL